MADQYFIISAPDIATLKTRVQAALTADATLTATGSIMYAGISFSQALATKPSGIGSFEDGITTHAAGGQADATLLTKNLNRVDTNASSIGSVKFEPALTGLSQWVINNTANDMEVFPNTADNFLGMAANTSITVVGGTSLQIFCFTDGELTILN